MSIATAPAPRMSPFAVFRNRNFGKIWTGQLISTMGSALTSLAASILVRATNWMKLSPVSRVKTWAKWLGLMAATAAAASTL